MRAALLSLLVVVGCKTKNPNYCEDKPDHLCDPPDAAAMACSDATDCTGADKVCKKPENVCVQCTTDDASACSGTAPVCDAMTNTCQGCTTHSDCADSNACLPDGSCAAAGDVAYVKAGETNNPTCSKATPCADVNAALAATPAKSIIRISGTITGATIAINNRDVTLLGDRNTSVLNRTTGNVISIDGTSKVKLYDLTISNASGNTGISAASGHTGDLEVQRCTVTNNGLGILYAGTGTFTLGRSEVSLNLNNGGISITQTTKFDITNNFIFRNGNTNTANIGGVSITSTTTMGARFEFNTVVDNQAIDGGGRSGGLFCDVNGLAVPNNLIARNLVAPANAGRAQVNGACAFTGSFVQADFANLIFKSPDAMPYDYHLKTGSSVVDMATGGTLMTDFDGQPRPNGDARDMGADEFYAQ